MNAGHAGRCQKSKKEELSQDEFEAVSGGAASRDWATEACASAVENFGWCWSDERCILRDVIYKHSLTECRCERRGGPAYLTDDAPYGKRIYHCKNCAYEKAIGVFETEIMN